MNQREFEARCKTLALEVVRLTEALPRSVAIQTVVRQVVRSSMSVGANYRAAARGRSDAEMIAKLGIVEEEADETMYWLEMLAELHPPRAESV
jgi:four helix bundle protein